MNDVNGYGLKERSQDDQSVESYFMCSNANVVAAIRVSAGDRNFVHRP